MNQWLNICIQHIRTHTYIRLAKHGPKWFYKDLPTFKGQISSVVMIPQAWGTSLHANIRGHGTSVCGVAEVRKAPGPQKGGGGGGGECTRMRLEDSRGHTWWVLEADRLWQLTTKVSHSPNVPSFLLMKQFHWGRSQHWDSGNVGPYFTSRRWNRWKHHSPYLDWF